MYGRRTAVLGIMTLVNAMATTVQNLSFGADNFYRSESYRTNVAGNLFYPRNLSRSVETPAIVVGHPMGAVKEQSANLYATKLAEQGFITISIDLPHWGGSDGEPRNAVSAEYYAEAFRAAVDYLGLQEFVDQRKELINAAAAQRWTESEGAEPGLIGGTVDRREDATDAIQQEFYDFYRTTRGEITPLGALLDTTTHPTRSSQVKFLSFYPFNDIDTIAPRPLLFVSGDQAHSREFSEEAYRLAAEPKELIWVPGAGHVDLYDRAELIPFDRLTRFFKQSL
ncbi:hypothetical protein FPSE_08017 [Fusarium pseudograminearum CS3096]|uniref:Uncharacterized protein n=1 Tax=Fusarium pseudograminearum (strain CS3096) TaxID=1028729 RepID=K3VD12_FUSPC|nr:hypothetical protein FPSE_08017 [Fusarium pseudograminearum CS3096]EKJ71832.1 hypothetical protein FPSE_08017 [Fusarium pseudograminearum CS3096]